MAYVAVKGGEAAIANAHAYLDEVRRGDRSITELTLEQIREQMSLAVDRVMTEGSCYDPDLAALALKQAMGDATEAIFLLRAYRTTLPRFGAALPIETDDMSVRRRVSAAYKDIPGGQVLGPTLDYTHRLLDFKMAAEGLGETDAPMADTPMPERLPTIAHAMASEGLIEEPPVRQHDHSGQEKAPYDLTRQPQVYPADRDQRLQALARGDEGFLLSIAYSSMRGYGTHPLCAEMRMGEVSVTFAPEELGFEIEIADITVSECKMLSAAGETEDLPPRHVWGYGLAFGQSERKAMSMAIVDRSLRAKELGEEVKHPSQTDEFILSHCDSLESSGFVQHLKLPHYVDFQAELQHLRKLRKKWDAKKAARDAEQTPEAAE